MVKLYHTGFLLHWSHCNIWFELCSVINRYLIIEVLSAIIPPEFKFKVLVSNSVNAVSDAAPDGQEGHSEE